MPRVSASWRANSVFPTPVGPAKRKFATGLPSARKPALERLTALTTAATASSCPKMRSLSLFSKSLSLSFSLSHTDRCGMRAIFEIIVSITGRLISIFSTCPFCTVEDALLPNALVSNGFVPNALISSELFPNAVVSKSGALFPAV